ncbi:hypothetical protein [Microbacterium sp.]|uniref:hypothetical protein n=1 Tax=Microbacterium sp. TaxID=51671 RepID=UPI0025CE2239|nr:hypothetical protein [Microbacterium sp.]
MSRASAPASSRASTTTSAGDQAAPVPRAATTPFSMRTQPSSTISPRSTMRAEWMTSEPVVVR